MQQSTGPTSDHWLKLGFFTLLFLTPATLFIGYDLSRPKEDRYVPINDTAYKISFSAYLSALLLYVLTQMMKEFCCKKNPENPGVIVTHSNYDSTAVNTQRVAVQPAAARAAAQLGLEPEPELAAAQPIIGRNVVDLDAPFSEKKTIDLILNKHSEIADMDHGIIFHPFLNNLKGYAELVADAPAHLPEWLQPEKYGDGTFAYLILNHGIYNALKGSIVEAIQRDNGTDGNSIQAPNTKKALTAIVCGYNKKGHYFNKTHLLNWERILGVITDLVNPYKIRFPSLNKEMEASTTYTIMKFIESLIENNNDTRESTVEDCQNSRDNLMGFLQITADAQSLLRTNEPGAGGDAASDEAGAHPERELAAAARRRPPPAYIATEADGQSSELFVLKKEGTLETGTASVENEQPPAYSPRPEADGQSSVLFAPPGLKPAAEPAEALELEPEPASVENEQRRHILHNP